MSEEGGGESGEIFNAFGQGGNRDFEDIEAIIEVFAKAACADFLAEGFIGGGDESEIDAEIFATADAGESSIFDEAEELRLNCWGDVGDFIEEERPALGAFDVTWACGAGTSEGIFFVAEEFAFEKCFW